MQSVNDFIAFDVETSGLNFRADQIIEICIVRVRNGVPTLIFNTLVQPTEDLQRRGLDPKVTEITGHVMEDLEGGITEADLADLVTAMLRPSDDKWGLLVAYNASFDLAFIDTLMLKYGYDTVDNDFVDPLTIARDRSGYPHKLSDMCKKMGVEMGEAHNAYDDTLALVDLFQAMQTEDHKYKEKPTAWYLNKLGYKRKFGPPEWTPEHATLYPQGAQPDITHNKKPSKTAPPKYTAVVTNNANKKKKRPNFAAMDNEDFSNEYLPTGMLNENATIAAIKSLIENEDPFSNYNLGNYCEVVVDINSEQGKYEFTSAIHYLKTQVGIKEKDISSIQDNPDEVIIGFRSPKGPIEIHEDDLPF